MKTLLKYSGIISAVLAIVAFILLLATPALSYTVASNFSSDKSVTEVAGTLAIFGGEQKMFLGTFKWYPTWAGLLAFIFIIVALIILICAIILPLLKVKALDKFAGALNLVAVISLILAGIFAFCIVAAYKAANGDASGAGFLTTASYSIGAGWVIAGILSIVAGVFAVLPAATDFISKK